MWENDVPLMSTCSGEKQQGKMDATHMLYIYIYIYIYIHKYMLLMLNFFCCSFIGWMNLALTSGVSTGSTLTLASKLLQDFQPPVPLSCPVPLFEQPVAFCSYWIGGGTSARLLGWSSPGSPGIFQAVVGLWLGSLCGLASGSASGWKAEWLSWSTRLRVCKIRLASSVLTWTGCAKGWGSLRLNRERRTRVLAVVLLTWMVCLWNLWLSKVV